MKSYFLKLCCRCHFSGLLVAFCCSLSVIDGTLYRLLMALGIGFGCMAPAACCQLQVPLVRVSEIFLAFQDFYFALSWLIGWNGPNHGCRKFFKT